MRSAPMVGPVISDKECGRNTNGWDGERRFVDW
jgi:hypothetical protein